MSVFHEGNLSLVLDWLIMLSDPKVRIRGSSFDESGDHILWLRRINSKGKVA
jgi:hypothetical protein